MLTLTLNQRGHLKSSKSDQGMQNDRWSKQGETLPLTETSCHMENIQRLVTPVFGHWWVTIYLNLDPINDQCCFILQIFFTTWRRFLVFPYH